jgi:putative serine protease PepD
VGLSPGKATVRVQAQTRTRPWTAKVLAAALAVGVAAAAVTTWRVEQTDHSELAAQAQVIAHLEAEVSVLENRSDAQPDWALLAATVEPSVVTIATGVGLGSGWVARSDAGGSDVLTNFHVVADAWAAGDASVDVRLGDETLGGTIVRVDREDDLAVVHVARRLAALRTAAARPQVGATLMAVGSPLGLSGTVSIGVVSAFRSVDGADYMQFSAPISPGSSGGPVVDRQGRVVAIASAKFVGAGVEALALAIPVQMACSGLIACGADQG